LDGVRPLGQWLRPTLADLTVGRDNNFNLLRFVAASIVLFSHCYPLTGHFADEPLAIASGGLTDIATIGVTIFFAISGFLIAQSVTRSRSLLLFAKSRALRLLPALALSTVFCVFVLGPIATELSAHAYFTNPRTWRFLFHTIALNPQGDLPGVFVRNVYPSTLNGSLWTIPVEAWCYAALAIAALIGLVKRRLALSLVLVAGSICFRFFEPAVRALVPFGTVYTTPYLIGIFFLGTICFLYRDRVPVSLPAAAMVALLAAVGLKTSFAGYAYYLGIGYLALCFAYHPRLRVEWFLWLGDYSYGIYVFAFPVQQFLVWWLGISSPMTLFVLSMPVTLLLAMISWHFVEKPALALKG